MGWLDETPTKGQQYVSSVPGIVPLPTPEKIVRPFQSFKERRDQRLEQLRAAPEAAHEAELCWGAAPKLQDSPTQTGGFPTFTTRTPEDEPEEPPETILVWTERDRKTKKIRVENPDDSDQYVMVERIEEWLATAPGEPPFNGRIHKFVFKNK